MRGYFRHKVYRLLTLVFGGDSSNQSSTPSLPCIDEPFTVETRKDLRIPSQFPDDVSGCHQRVHAAIPRSLRQEPQAVRFVFSSKWVATNPIEIDFISRDSIQCKLSDVKNETTELQPITLRFHQGWERTEERHERMSIRLREGNRVECWLEGRAFLTLIDLL